MILDFCEQNTEIWMIKRSSIISASEVSRFITPKTMKKSAGWRPYACEIAAFQITGELDHEWSGNSWTERGHDLEPVAISEYELISDNDTFSVGLIYSDESKTVGASPDALVDEGGVLGGLEIKSLGQKKHAEHLLNNKVPDEHFAQIQMSLWITKLPWWDFYSYHPMMKPLLVRATPDKAYQRILDELIPEMLLEIMFIKSKIQ